MKKVSLILVILFLTFGCGTKRVIYNNKSEESKKEIQAKKEKPKKKKSKKAVIKPKILNTEDYVKYFSSSNFLATLTKSGNLAMDSVYLLLDGKSYPWIWSHLST